MSISAESNAIIGAVGSVPVDATAHPLTPTTKTLPANTVQVSPITPTTGPVGAADLIVFWVCIAWAVAGLVAATLLRAFRRESIVGPVRANSLEDAGSLFLIGIVGYLIALVIGKIVYSHLTVSDELKPQILQAVVLAALFCGIVGTLRFARPGSLFRLGLSPGWMFAGLLGGAATLFIIEPLIQICSQIVVIIQRLFQDHPEPEVHELLVFMGKTRNAWWRMLSVVSAVILAPMTEELIFRGLLQTLLGRFFSLLQAPIQPAATEYSAADLVSADRQEFRQNPLPDPGAGARWAAVIVTAILFAASHQSLIFFLPLFVLALALGYVYERTGNLWVNVTTHALFNASQILLYFAAMR